MNANHTQKLLTGAVVVLLVILVLAFWPGSPLQALRAGSETPTDVPTPAASGDTSHVDEEGGAHEHEHGHAVKLDPEQIREFGIVISTAAPGSLDQALTLTGEVRLNEDRMTHVTPRVSGVVKEVYRTIGDTVKQGDVLAILESRELAEAKAAWLAAREREELARTAFQREESLWRKKISAQQDYLDARQALAEAGIQLRLSRQKLLALGFTAAALDELAGQEDGPITRYEITAPFSGRIIEKHASLGEVMEAGSSAFVIADLGTVWIDLTVYRNQMSRIRAGQPARISAGADLPEMTGTITYVAPLVGETTRAAVARVVLTNPSEVLRPGLFVTSTVSTGRIDVPVLVPRDALQTFEGKDVVFILDDDGFEPRPVTLGRETRDQVEITDGLAAGNRYVSQGAFVLKAQLSRDSFGDGHHH